MLWTDTEEGLQKIKKLEKMGAVRWTQYGHDRLYLNKAGSKLAGLEISRYNTGRVSLAKLDGEKIPNSRGGLIAGTVEDAYIDLTDNKIYYVRTSDELVVQAIQNLKKNLKLV